MKGIVEHRIAMLRRSGIEYPTVFEEQKLVSDGKKYLEQMKAFLAGGDENDA